MIGWSALTRTVRSWQASANDFGKTLHIGNSTKGNYDARLTAFYGDRIGGPANGE